MLGQTILFASEHYDEITQYLKEQKLQRILLVCGNSLFSLKIGNYLRTLKESIGISVVCFSDFQPNPQYESVVRGIQVFLQEDCDGIIAAGGGSALDVAKCIKLYSNMDPSRNYLVQDIVPNDIPLLAIPTAAGTGSEATRYAVIYYEGQKQSVTHDSIVPSAVVFDPSTLETLPVYQKKVTLMDALCHSIESFWSIHSTPQSRAYSKEAIQLILENWEAYLAGDNSKNQLMMNAANIAGKAINITQTTAGHAMSYKMTSLYGIAHGHATALCVPALWSYMVQHPKDCIDDRGEAYVWSAFQEIAETMGYSNAENAIEKLWSMNDAMLLYAPEMKNFRDYDILKGSVNPVRLRNNPIGLNEDGIDWIYHRIFEEQKT